MAGAMSLAAVDHVKDDENESYFAFSKVTAIPAILLLCNPEWRVKSIIL